jgi:exosortase
MARGRRRINTGEITPRVTLIISAYNEGKSIGEKLENSLALNYPQERLEILVVSDASTDGTDEVVNRYRPMGIRLIWQLERQGKTAGLNRAVSEASGEIVVFSDANALYHPDAIRKLVRNFNDPDIGYVTGDSRYILDAASGVSLNEGLYWQYERLLKRLETMTGSMVGADGAIYALRRSLYQELHKADINDFVNPLQVIARGFRGVYEPEAICYENTTVRFEEEFRRKVRIISRSWRGLWRVRQVLNPFQYGLFSWMVVSHKLLRWLVPFFLVTAMISNFFLFSVGDVYRSLFFAQGAFYMIATAGFIFTKQNISSRFLNLVYYFCLMNVASMIGVAKGIMGTSHVIWEPERKASNDPVYSKVLLGNLDAVVSNKGIYLQGGIVTVLFFMVHYPLFLPLVKEWYNYSFHSHGFLIPLISLYLIWAKRESLKDVVLTPHPLGLAVLVGGLLLGILGDLGDTSFLQQIGMVVTLIGLIDFLLGWALVRRLAFPLVYLVFMIPVPYTIYKFLAQFLRQFDADVSASIIASMGIPIFKEGNLLHLPDITLEVADACSGFLSLFALMALGSLYLYLGHRKMIIRWVLFFLIPPLAIATNLFRIILTVILVYQLGPVVLQSLFHKFYGTFNFLITFGLLVGMAKGLEVILQKSRLGAWR